jgi:hypothetical protein
MLHTYNVATRRPGPAAIFNYGPLLLPPGVAPSDDPLLGASLCRNTTFDASLNSVTMTNLEGSSPAPSASVFSGPIA